MDASVIDRLAQANVLVVGDVLLDRFVDGKVGAGLAGSAGPGAELRRRARSCSAAPATSPPTSSPTARR